MRPKPAYYSVFAIKDGTIVFAMQTRKPPKNSLGRGQRIDEDGIHRWFITNKDSYYQQSDRETIIGRLAVAGRLNTRRSIRELLFPKLDALEKQVAELQHQLVRQRGLGNYWSVEQGSMPLSDWKHTSSDRLSTAIWVTRVVVLDRIESFLINSNP